MTGLAARSSTGLAGIAAALVLGASLQATAAQETQEIIELRKKVEAQETLIRELLEWKKSVEARPATNLQPTAASMGSKTAAVTTDSGLSTTELGEKIENIERRLTSGLNLSGYYDFDFIYKDLPGSHPSFDQHQVSLHLSKELGNFRVFSEVEFEHGPKFEGDGTQLEASRGEIVLEQAWGEYVFSDPLTIRAGLMLHPNYWNLNHYPNVVLPVRRPSMVREIFPESLTGIMAYGSKYWGDFGLSYSVHLSNGEGPLFTGEDDNDTKAAGARMLLHLPSGGFFDTFNVGLVGYADSPAAGRRTRTWGVEAQLRKGPWEILAEFADRSGSQDRFGLYVQPSYRFNVQWAAYGRYELLDDKGGIATHEYTLGVNFRPLPPVSLKLEGFRSEPSNGQGGFGVASSFVIGF